MNKLLTTARRIGLSASAILLAACATLPSTAQAAAKQPTAGAAENQTVPAEESSQAEPTPAPIFDLGKFRMNNLHPSQNTTIKLVFAVQLQLKDEVDPAVARQLDRWLHRLRSQVTTAIRSAELVDYTEPDLHRIQTLILLRVNRALPLPLIDRIYITEFTVGDH